MTAPKHILACRGNHRIYWRAALGKPSAEDPASLLGRKRVAEKGRVECTQELDYMKRRHNFSRYPSHERGFANEAQFLKFAKPRDPDNVTNLVRAVPECSAKPILSELTTEATESPVKAKGALA